MEKIIVLGKEVDLSNLDKKTVEFVLDYLSHKYLDINKDIEDCEKAQRIKIGFSKSIDCVKELHSRLK